MELDRTHFRIVIHPVYTSAQVNDVGRGGDNEDEVLGRVLLTTISELLLNL